MRNSARLTAVKGWLGRIFPKGGMAYGAMALAGSTILGQVLGVLLSPIYSRIYTPADYGVFSVYNAIVTTALTVGSLCYEQAIPVARDDRESVRLTVLAILLVGLIGIGILSWIWLMSMVGSGKSQLELGLYLWLVPVGVVGAGVYQAIRYWALRRKEMVAIARSTIPQLVFSSIIGLPLGLLWHGPLGLILAGVASFSAGGWVLARRTHLHGQLKENWKQGMHISQLWLLAKNYKKFPLISAPSTLFNSLGLFLPGIMLAPYYGVAFAGQFFMGMKILSLPVGLVGGTIRQVFFSGAAAIARENPKELARYFHRMFNLALACSLLVVIVGLVAPWLIPLALGEKWRMAGQIVLWLTPYSALGLSVSALSTIPNITGRLQGQFVIDVTRALAVFLLLFIGHRVGLSGLAFVKGYTLLMTVNYFACYCLYVIQVKQVTLTGLTGWNQVP